MTIYMVKTDIEGLQYWVDGLERALKLAKELNGFDGGAQPFQLIPELNCLTVH